MITMQVIPQHWLIHANTIYCSILGGQMHLSIQTMSPSVMHVHAFYLGGWAQIHSPACPGSSPTKPFFKNIMVNVCKPFYNWQTKGQPKLGDYLHFG